MRPSKLEQDLKRLKSWKVANPEKAKQTQANWREKNKEKHRKAVREWRLRNKERSRKVESERARRRFFHTRAKNCVWRTKEGNVAEIRNAIFWIWKRQKGLCALTGKRLDRTAELDHIVPISKGGKNEPSNLQWLAPEVNQCKNDLSVDELVCICRLILANQKNKNA